MENIEPLFQTIIMVSALVVLLNIILFLKIWTMTGHVKEIKDTLKEWLDLEHPVVEDDQQEKKEA